MLFSTKKLRSVFIFAFSLILVLAPALMAQTAGTGAIKGTVTDSSGAAVANATVLATNTGTGGTRTATTGADGGYVFSLLPLGTYSLKIDATGFNSETIPSVVVNVAETATLNATLQVGSQTTAVTVEETAVAVNTTNATLGTEVAAATATALPLNTRNYTNLLGLSSGANGSVFNASTLGKGSTDIAVNGADIKQNGLYMDGISITNSSSNGTLSGNANDPGIGLVEPDAIQEFKIQTSMFDAGYGRNAGASVNVVTKTGTNDFHGSAFEFFRNTVLNANDFFLNRAGKPRGALDQNQYGGTIGGPVKKDKLFFFASYQQTWQKNGLAAQGLSSPQLLPIPGINGAIGSDRGSSSNQAAFAAQVGAEFCPTGPDGGVTGAGGVQIACDGSNINPVALNVLQLKNPDGSYLIPSAPGQLASAKGVSATSPGAYSVPATFTEEQFLGNVDYVINSKNTLSLHYFLSRDPVMNPFGCSSGNNCYPDSATAYLYENHYANFQVTTIVNNNLVNHVYAGFTRGTVNAQLLEPFTNNQVGITSILSTQNYLDAITVNGLFKTGAQGGIPTVKTFTNIFGGDDISWTHGKHTIRFGGSYERDRYDWTFAALSVGNITFPFFQDFLLGLQGCPPGASCPIVNNQALYNGVPTTGTSGSNISSSGNFQSQTPPGGLNHTYRDPFADLWIQDDYKITRKLTINLGLRWEYQAIMTDHKGYATNIYPSLINANPIPGNSPSCPPPVGVTLAPGQVCTPGSLAGFVVPSNFNFSAFPSPLPGVAGLVQSPHLGTQQNNTPLDTFSPRVGFAWSPLDSNKLTIRSGFGLFDDRAGALDYVGGVTQNIPYSVPLFQTTATANYFSSFANPYQIPASPWTPRYVNFTTGQTSNLSSNFLAPNYNRTPVVYQWNLTVQYQFLPTWTLELGYVGSRGVHQEGLTGIPSFTGQAINAAQLVPVAGLPAPGGVPAAGISQGLVTTNTAANASLRVPYLGFNPSMLMFYNDEGTKYNGAQATVKKQLSHGVTLQAAYSFSRSFGTEFGYNSPNTAVYELNPVYHPQRLAINYQWTLPFNREGMMGKFTNGWAVSGVTILQDGVPITATNSKGGTIYGYGPGAIQVSTAEYCPAGGSIASSGSTEQRLGGASGGTGWFNTASVGNAACPVPVSPYASPEPGKTTPTATGWGNLGPSILLGPGQFNWDISIIKTTQVGGLREDGTLVFRTEFFNAFNHPQFANPGSLDASTGTFGQITTSSVNPRLIQFALKYTF